MSNVDSTNGNHHPDDEHNEPMDRIDANPPYRAEKVVGFRKLLAELIARRIVAARRGPPDVGRQPKRGPCNANAGAGRLRSGPGYWPENTPGMTAEIVWFWKPHLGQ